MNHKKELIKSCEGLNFSGLCILYDIVGLAEDKETVLEVIKMYYPNDYKKFNENKGYSKKRCK